MDDAIDKSMEIIPEINKQYKEDALKAQVTAAKSSLKSINKKIAPVLHYSTQAFALYHKNQMNTYQMSGMTSAAIRTATIRTRIITSTRNNNNIDSIHDQSDIRCSTAINVHDQ